MFRPFTDEILVGKIKSCSKEGVNGEFTALCVLRAFPYFFGEMESCPFQNSLIDLGPRR